MELTLRVWDKQNKTMLYDGFCVALTDTAQKKQWAAFETTPFRNPTGLYDYIKYHPCLDDADRYIPMLCTGCKDSEGNEIYEGDIVEIAIYHAGIKLGRKRDVVEINLQKGTWLKHEIKGCAGEQLIDPADTVRVGNVYGNPELSPDAGRPVPE